MRYLSFDLDVIQHGHGLVIGFAISLSRVSSKVLTEINHKEKVIFILSLIARISLLQLDASSLQIWTCLVCNLAPELR